MAEASQTQEPRRVEVTARNLPLHCPMSGAPLWARHPRIFLDVVTSGEAMCPYCGAHYVFKGDRPKGQH